MPSNSTASTISVLSGVPSTSSGRTVTPPPPPLPNVQTLEDEFMVEKILDRRVNKGRIQYLIKWQGFADQDNTWEPEQNLADCPDLIKDFERRLRENMELSKRNPHKAAEQDRPTPVSIAPRPKAHDEGNKETRIGFDRNMIPHKIIGATDCGGELCFLMKWKGSTVADIIPAREANVKCPQVVIKFYEDRIRWNTKRPLEEMLGEDEDDEPVENNSREQENASVPSGFGSGLLEWQENLDVEEEEVEDDDAENVEPIVAYGDD